MNGDGWGSGWVDDLEEASHFANVWATRAREATAKRDEWIRKMSSEGASLSTIGRAVGMTPPGVARVIKRAPKPLVEVLRDVLP